MATTVGLLRDRISNLPDSILVTILSSLPIDKAARCSILASRWRHLFPSTLLDFRAFTCSGRLDIVKAVTAILAAHPTEPVRSFVMGELYVRPEDRCVVDGWLRDLANRGIQELSLYFRCSDEIPECIFACSSLKRLHLTNGTFPDAAAAATSLARLTEINLSSVRISEDSLNSLLSHCVALEHLTIDSRINSLHLKSRSIKILNCSGCDFKELYIHDCPNLERVLDRYLQQRKVHTIKIVHAPKLEFLGYIGMSNNMEIGDTIFTEKIIDVKNIMPSMKTLAVDLSCDQQGYIKEGYIDWIMQLLKFFPCLETLYIRSSSWSGAKDVVSGSWEMQRSVPCVLEKVVFQVYRGHKWQRAMAKFLHRRSKVLKIMEFHCMDDGSREGFGKTPTEEWVREQKEHLCLDSTAARDASFLFFKTQMVVNHLEVCHEERYRRNYYRNMYFDESILHGESGRAY
ncbi:unnamed protein product [Alopecurus aequalis]